MSRLGSIVRKLTHRPETVTIGYKIIHEDAMTPHIAYEGDVGGSACFDLYAVEDVKIPPKTFKEVSCGLSFEIPPYWEMTLRGRSGHARNGIQHHMGTVDSNFKGPVGTITFNHSRKTYVVQKGERICQVAVRPVPKVVFKEVKELSETHRNEKGFGSSGTH